MKRYTSAMFDFKRWKHFGLPGHLLVSHLDVLEVAKDAPPNAEAQRALFVKIPQFAGGAAMQSILEKCCTCACTCALGLVTIGPGGAVLL